MGIVEGITEWLPISSTGHMILLEQIIKFNASEEFMSMFRVVIQLGAIMAVVVLFWGKLWPFGMKQGRVISKPSVWSLWFKVVAATIPVLIISPLDDWMEAHFYNYITVAAMLILYGALFFVVENRRAAPHVSRLEHVAQTVSILVIDKGRMKLKEAGLPDIVIENTPKYLRRSKVPVVKAKVGPKIMTLMCDAQVYPLIPVKKEVKATISGIYITAVKGVRGPLDVPEKKKGFFARLRNK